jgi:hypothetical protein
MAKKQTTFPAPVANGEERFALCPHYPRMYATGGMVESGEEMWQDYCYCLAMQGRQPRY